MSIQRINFAARCAHFSIRLKRFTCVEPLSVVLVPRRCSPLCPTFPGKKRKKERKKKQQLRFHSDGIVIKRAIVRVFFVESWKLDLSFLGDARRSSSPWSVCDSWLFHPNRIAFSRGFYRVLIRSHRHHRMTCFIRPACNVYRGSAIAARNRRFVQDALHNGQAADNGVVSDGLGLLSIPLPTLRSSPSRAISPSVYLSFSSSHPL